MKIKNIFKKSTKVVAKAKVQRLEKTQLERVIGGAEERQKLTGLTGTKGDY